MHSSRAHPPLADSRLTSCQFIWCETTSWIGGTNTNLARTFCWKCLESKAGPAGKKGNGSIWRLFAFYLSQEQLKCGSHPYGSCLFRGFPPAGFGVKSKCWKIKHVGVSQGDDRAWGLIGCQSNDSKGFAEKTKSLFVLFSIAVVLKLCRVIIRLTHGWIT